MENIKPVAWLREQRGDCEGKETLDPFFVLGAQRPRNFENGATYEPLFDKAALGAAVAAARADERERCAKIVKPALTWMENAWHQIDGEWGPSGKSLDEECAEGLEPEIELLREFLKT